MAYCDGQLYTQLNVAYGKLNDDDNEEEEEEDEDDDDDENLHKHIDLYSRPIDGETIRTLKYKAVSSAV